MGATNMAVVIPGTAYRQLLSTARYSGPPHRLGQPTCCHTQHSLPCAQARTLALQPPRQLRLSGALVALVRQVQVARQLAQQLPRHGLAAAQVGLGWLTRALGKQVAQPARQLRQRQRLQLLQLRELLVEPAAAQPRSERTGSATACSNAPWANRWHSRRASSVSGSGCSCCSSGNSSLSLRQHSHARSALGQPPPARTRAGGAAGTPSMSVAAVAAAAAPKSTLTL